MKILALNFCLRFGLNVVQVFILTCDTNLNVRTPTERPVIKWKGRIFFNDVPPCLRAPPAPAAATGATDAAAADAGLGRGDESDLPPPEYFVGAGAFVQPETQFIFQSRSASYTSVIATCYGRQVGEERCESVENQN